MEKKTASFRLFGEHPVPVRVKDALWDKQYDDSAYTARMKHIVAVDDRIKHEENKLRKLYNPAYSPVNRETDEEMEEREKRRKQPRNKQPNAPPLWLRRKLNYKPPVDTTETFYQKRFNEMLREKLERDAKQAKP